jgi:hypothetical protein
VIFEACIGVQVKGVGERARRNDRGKRQREAEGLKVKGTIERTKSLERDYHREGQETSERGK